MSEICSCGHYKYAHNGGIGKCKIKDCWCIKYRDIKDLSVELDKLSVVLKEKNEAISNLIKEHNMLRKQLDVALDALGYISRATPLEMEDQYVSQTALRKMDNIKNEYFKSNDKHSDQST